METDQERLERLREVGARIASAAAELQVVAEQLRIDVDALTVRMSAVEDGNMITADELVKSDKKVEDRQIVQDGRLDSLETNDTV